MYLTRRQVIEAGVATGALALVSSSPLLAQVINPAVRPALPAVPARPRVMVDPIVDPRIVARARAAFDRHRSRIFRGDVVGIADFTKASADPRFYLLDTNSGRVTSHLVAHGRGSDPMSWRRRLPVSVEEMVGGASPLSAVASALAR